MMSDKADQAQVIAAGAPDEILAELWEVKREINRAGDYRIDTLAQMAHESAERIRQQGAGTPSDQGPFDPPPTLGRSLKLLGLAPGTRRSKMNRPGVRRTGRTPPPVSRPHPHQGQGPHVGAA